MNDILDDSEMLDNKGNTINLRSFFKIYLFVTAASTVLLSGTDLLSTQYDFMTDNVYFLRDGIITFAKIAVMVAITEHNRFIISKEDEVEKTQPAIILLIGAILTVLLVNYGYPVFDNTVTATINLIHNTTYLDELYRYVSIKRLVGEILLGYLWYRANTPQKIN